MVAETAELRHSAAHPSYSSTIDPHMAIGNRLSAFTHNLKERLIASPVHDRMSIGRIMAYAAPFMPLSALGLPISIYLPPFYASEMGVGLTVLGVIFMVSRFWDIFTDPLMGVLGDKFPSRYGRRRHWIVLSVPVLMVSVLLVFMPQYVIGDSAHWSYVFLSMLLLYAGYTMATLSHLSWGAELSTDYHERSRIQGWREFVHVFGMVSVLALPAVLELSGGKPTYGERLEVMGWYILILLPVTTLLAVYAVGERKTAPSPQVGWRKSVAALLKNTLLIRVVVADILLVTPPAIMGVIYAFFVEYVIQAPSVPSAGLLLYFGLTLLGVPLWINLSRRIGKHRAVALAAILHAINTLAVLRLGPGDMFGFLIYMAVEGVIYGGSMFIVKAIVADITDQDSLEVGTQRTGLLFSLMAVSAKVGPALAVGLTYPMLEFFDFDPSAETNTPQAIDALRYIFAIMPVIPPLIAAALLYNFPLDETRHRELRRLLDERSSAAPTAGE